MEGGIAGLGLASGMAAITYAIQTIAAVGDNIVSISQLYGGTYNLFMHAFPRQGIEVRMAGSDDYEAIEALIDDKTKAVFLESIGNPAGSSAGRSISAPTSSSTRSPNISGGTAPRSAA